MSTGRKVPPAIPNIVGSGTDSGDWIDEDSAPGRQSAETGSLGRAHPELPQGDTYTGSVNSSGNRYAGASTSARANPYPSLRKKRKGTQGGVTSGRWASGIGPRGQAFSQTAPAHGASGSSAQEFKEETHTLPSRRGAPDGVITGVHQTSDYAIIRPALLRLRIPLSFILSFFLLALILGLSFLLLTFILTIISSTVSSAFSPFCHIPGVSSTFLCPGGERVGSSDGRPVQWADYGTLFKVQSQTFERMVDESLLGPITPSSLSLSFKKSEMATADLIGLVRLSDLKNRQSLVNALSEFVNDAREAGLSLARLDAKMNGALDSIMAVNEYALGQIESAREKEPSKLVNALVPWRQGKTVDEVVKETFLDAMDMLNENLERVVLEVLVNTQNLNALKEKLKTIHDIVARDHKSVTEERDALTDDILGKLWTKLGGNDKDLRNFGRNLGLLEGIGDARDLASARVAATFHTLQKADREMQDMRERVAAPNLAKSRIPPEVHMKVIRAGLDRLAEGRERAKALEQEALRNAFAAES